MHFPSLKSFFCSVINHCIVVLHACLCIELGVSSSKIPRQLGNFRLSLLLGRLGLQGLSAFFGSVARSQ